MPPPILERLVVNRGRWPVGYSNGQFWCRPITKGGFELPEPFLRREHVNLKRARLWVERLKGSLSVEHPIAGDELRAIRKLLVARADGLPWLFVSERGAPLTRHAVNYLIATAGRRAGLGHLHPHMLRHSCGYALADRGTDFRVLQDFLGHRDPSMTVRYTRIAGRRFECLWR